MEHSIGQEMQLSFSKDKTQELKNHLSQDDAFFCPAGPYVCLMQSTLCADFLNCFSRLWMLLST